MFHVKHWANGVGKRDSAKQPHALKITLVFQRHDYVQIRHVRAQSECGFGASVALRPRDKSFSAAQQIFPFRPLRLLSLLLCKIGEAVARGRFSIAIFAAQQNTALRNDVTAGGLVI